jgi:hypothetical protein
VGFGPTNPAVPAGKVSSGAAPSPILPQVTIGGVLATVTFAGIVETGLFQLNVVVPSVASGDQPRQASIGGLTTEQNVVLTVQSICHVMTACHDAIPGREAAPSRTNCRPHPAGRNEFPRIQSDESAGRRRLLRRPATVVYPLYDFERLAPFLARDKRFAAVSDGIREIEELPLERFKRDRHRIRCS